MPVKGYAEVNNLVVLQINNPKVIKDGTISDIETDNSDIKPKIIQGRTFVPLRTISEALGYDVKWDEENQTIFVGKNLKDKTIEDIILQLGSIYKDYIKPSIHTGKKTSKAINTSKKMSKAQILDLLKKYSPDGYFILNSSLSRNKDFMRWFKSENSLEDIGTAVHEECHGYTHSYSYKNGYDGNRYSLFYLGDGQTITVRHTKVFKSEEIAATIPENLRTFRYCYIGNAPDNLNSNADGVYGLLNEFTAYYYGVKADYELYDYYMTLKQTPETWLNYIGNIEGQYISYAEFKFYILKYLIYAKEKHPDIYDEIIKNKEFKIAFNTIDQKFYNLINNYFNKKKELFKYLRKMG
ncbi:MAG: hypothetical protein PWP31_1426, partial [Clostridia bacterium]|nr:hypothetical protein [Clostridia bacterium]